MSAARAPERATQLLTQVRVHFPALAPAYRQQQLVAMQETKWGTLRDRDRRHFAVEP